MGGGFGVWGVWGLVFFDQVEEHGRGKDGARGGGGGLGVGGGGGCGFSPSGRKRGGGEGGGGGGRGGSELLHVVQLAVVAVKGEELGVCAALYNRAVVYDANHVGVLYR